MDVKNEKSKRREMVIVGLLERVIHLQYLGDK